MIMPEMSGDECFRAIRRMDPAAAVLVVSGYARDKRIDDLEAEGLLGFVRKPFTIDTLQRAVSAALARRDRAGGI
jgi:DNA-binding NarL/FixJ family response regulator